MAGELWRGTVQIGKETTPGTGVAATRRIYTMEPSLNRGISPRFHDFATGDRSPTRQVTQGLEAPGGQIRQSLSSSELVELLLMGLKGGVTPTTPGGATNTRLWTFVPDATALDAATVEWDDGAREWESYGTHVDELRFAGNAKDMNEVTATLFGRSTAQSTLTGSLPHRVPEFVEGWQSRIYIDAFAGTPGSSFWTDLLHNWEITIANGLQRKYMAANTRAAQAISSSPIQITARCLFYAPSSMALTESTAFAAATKRLVRFEFQDETGFIEGAFRRFVTIDIPGAWEAEDLGQADENTRAYQMSYKGIYDPTNAFPLQVRCQNARTTAYSAT